MAAEGACELGVELGLGLCGREISASLPAQHGANLLGRRLLCALLPSHCARIGRTIAKNAFSLFVCRRVRWAVADARS